MAQLGLGVVGGVAGFILSGGNPIGAQIGFALGAAAGGYIERANQKPIEGPRLSDLNISASTYGLVIPEIRGAVRLPGNMIWSTGLRERRQRVGGKGSQDSKGPAQNRYTYDASFAFAFCAGAEGHRVLRIWLDNKLAFDRTGSSESITVPGLRFRFYEGTEFQLPDSAIVADKGEADAPAYRGLCYIVFDSVPLEQFGNRIPQISAEIASAATVADTSRATVNLSGANGNPLTAPVRYGEGTTVDWQRKIALRGQVGTGSVYGIGVQDIANGTEFRVKTVAEMHAGTIYGVVTTRPDGLYVIPGGAGFYTDDNNLESTLTRFDPVSLTVTGQAFTTSHVNLNNRLTLPPVTSLTHARVLGVDGSRDFLLFACRYGWVRVVDAQTMESVWGMSAAYSAEASIVNPPSWPFMGSNNFGRAFVVQGEQREDETDVWILTGGNSASFVQPEADCRPRLHKLVLTRVSTFDPTSGIVSGVRFTPDVAIFEMADIHPEATRVRPEGLAYDPSDNCVFFNTQEITPDASDSVRVTKVDSDGLTVWSTVTTRFMSLFAGRDVVDGDIFPLMRGGSTEILDLRTGALRSYAYASDLGNYVYDSASRSVVTNFSGASNEQRRVWIDRLIVNPDTVQNVVTWLCGRAGLGAADIDVASLTGAVQGFAVGQQSARDALQQLAGAYYFDMVESDDKMRFVKRGSASVVTIPYADLVRAGRDQPALAPVRTQELELPRRLVVRYRDADKDQQSGAQPWSRQSAPTALVSSREEAVLDLSNLVMDASAAKGIARVRGTTAWAERDRLEQFNLTAAYLRLDPADPLTITRQDGSTQRVRLDRVEIQPDFSIRCAAVYEDASLYSLTAVGDGGQGHEEQTVPGAYASVLLAGNAPLIEDADDTGGAALRIYAAGGGYSNSWLGGRLFLSRDGSSWTSLLSTRTGMAWGRALNVLPAPESHALTDTANTLRVSMQAGADALDTVTELQWRNGANRALLMNSAGQIEMIRFRDVTSNGDGTFTLSHLRRGLRGSEWACGLHDVGGLFVLVDDALRALTLPLSDLNDTLRLRLAGLFDSFDYVPIESRIFTGAAEKPWAPCSITASRDGSDNITFTWKRRTRIGGQWEDFTGTVPLGEASEAYEIDVMDGTAVARTITGITSPSAAYSAVNQTADFGSVQNPVTIKVYQISEAVGRGYAGEATV